MLKDMLSLYFEHQQPPGSSFFEKGRYELVQGPDRREITSAQWDSTVAPGGTVEMSIQVAKTDFSSAECPRCYEPSSANGWTTWLRALLRVRKLYLSYFQSKLPEALQHSNKPAFLHYKQRGKVRFHSMMNVDENNTY
jgi:hypothetical protein